MSRRRFLWRDITALCSGDEHACKKKCLTESPGVRYAQKLENTGFFSNMTTVLSLSDLVGDHTVPVQDQRKHPLTLNRDQDARNGMTDP